MEEKRKKVWCLLITQTCDLEVYQPRIPIVSDNYQEVLAAFNEFVEDTKDSLNGWKFEADDEGWFEAYEEFGRYTENNVLAMIIEKNIGELSWSD